VAVGHAVKYDVVSDAVVKCVGVTGTIQFATDRSTRLSVHTLLIYPKGRLEVGTSTDPVPPDQRAEIVFPDQPFTTKSDPEQYGLGLIGFGTVVMHGAPRTPTFSRLAVEPEAGHTTLTLTDDPVGWVPGDVLLLPGTTMEWAQQLEFPTIKAISGRIVTLAAPLAFAHRGARDATGAVTFLPHVANVGRTVTVKSANHQSPNRGHVIFIGDAEVDIRYAYFANLGRTRHDVPLASATGSRPGNNQIGRYPTHFHHMTKGPTFIGNVVQGSPKWGITLHNTHFGVVRENVVLNAGGAGIVTEDGSETGNVIEHNFVVFTPGVTEWAAGRDPNGDDLGFEGSCYWFRGFGNIVRDNVAAQCRLYGYTYFAHSLGTVSIPRGPRTTQRFDVDGNAQPIAEFARNEVYASEDGLTIWYLNTFGQTARGGSESFVRDFRVWHFKRYGYFGYHTNKLTFERPVMRGLRDPIENDANFYNFGFFYSDYFTKDHVVRDADVQNVKVGMLAPVFMNDYGTPGGDTRVEGGFWRNFYGFLIEPMWTVAGTKGMPPKRLVLSRVKIDVLPRLTGQATIVANYKVGNYNLVQRDEILVLHHNGVDGDSFQLYYVQQAPDFVVPQSGSAGFPNLVGSPEGGLTNAWNWTKHRVAIAGAPAPCTITRPFVGGFTCPTSLGTSAPE
jgi:hypothetical protein